MPAFIVDRLAPRSSQEHNLLADALKDEHVTDAEYDDVLAPLVASAPPVASDTSRALLDLWGDGSVTFDARARRALGGALYARGYPTHAAYDADGPASSDFVRPGPRVPAQLAAANITERDATLARLLDVVGARGKVKIAVVDPGFPDAKHPALAGAVTLPHGAAPAWHATMVAGTALQGTDRISIVAGSVDAMSSPRAFAQVIAAGARVINTSYFEPDHAAYLAAVDAHPDVLFVKSAGNYKTRVGALGSSYEPDEYLPAHIKANLVVVANAGPDGAIWDGDAASTRGAPFVTLGAPGEGRHGASENRAWGAGGGTSNAAPYVTNVAAKCLVLDPALGARDLKLILTTTADADPRWTEHAQYGVVNKDRALTLAAMSALVRAGATPVEAAARVGVASDDALVRHVDALFGVFRSAPAAPNAPASTPASTATAATTTTAPVEPVRALRGRSESVRFDGDRGVAVFVDDAGATHHLRVDDRAWLNAFARAHDRDVTVQVDATGALVGFTVWL